MRTMKLIVPRRPTCQSTCSCMAGANVADPAVCVSSRQRRRSADRLLPKMLKDILAIIGLMTDHPSAEWHHARKAERSIFPV